MKNKLKKGEKYKVLFANLERVYHHGSWFIHVWKLKLSNGKDFLEGDYQTDDDYKQLQGKYIELKYSQGESGIEFEVVNP